MSKLIDRYFDIRNEQDKMLSDWGLEGVEIEDNRGNFWMCNNTFFRHDPTVKGIMKYNTNARIDRMAVIEGFPAIITASPVMGEPDICHIVDYHKKLVWRE